MGTLILLVVVLGGMIIVHEFGHFIVARLFNIEVEEFGIGLPVSPRIATLFTWHGTEFTLYPFLLGGFVRPKGENDPDVPDGLAAANPWKRLAVLFAGPLMNLLTAVVVTAIIIAQTGIAIPGKLLIVDVTAGSPAAQAGLKTNDVIVSIMGETVTDANAAIKLIRANLNKPVAIVVKRDGQDLTISATPLSSRTLEQGALGIALGFPTRPASPSEVITGAFADTWAGAGALAYLPIGLIQGAIQPNQVHFTGFKGMYDVLNSAVQQDSQSRQQISQAPAGSTTPPAPPTDDVLSVIVLLSITLGIFNLFPIPALDGGRILFTLPEILIRRRIPTRFENTVNAIAFFLLIGLMVYVNVMDFINPLKLP